MSQKQTSMADYLTALRHFQHARLWATWEQVLAYITGHSPELLSYEEVRHKLKAQQVEAKATLQDIPLDAIVGSVGRYADFTRSFLPLSASDKHRWANVELGFSGLIGLPPIEVYQIGEVYFVKDGNHRVSVARQLGLEFIEAYVTKVKTRVPLTPDVEPDDLILKAEYADFLAETDLDHLRPEADLTITAPGKYVWLKAEIDLQHLMLEQERGATVPYAEAVTTWYDKAYLPIVSILQERGMLRAFPKRTVTDMYIWLIKYQADLQGQLNRPIWPETLIDDLITRYSPQPQHRLARLGHRLLDTVTPPTLKDNSLPGEWRQEWSPQQRRKLFRDILVPLAPTAPGWQGLAQAIVLAQIEQSRLNGLCVVESDKQGQQTEACQAEFATRCQAAGVVGELQIVVGQVVPTVNEFARRNDLVVLRTDNSQPSARLGSTLRGILWRCPRPVLTVPHLSPKLESILLAYDGSAKAREALFIATYLAARWSIRLVLLTVLEAGRTTAETAERARQYVHEQGGEATIITQTGNTADLIRQVARDQHSDLILIGGYGHRPLLEVVVGSTVDTVLRTSSRPILVCR